ncbi:deoxyguanosinetriphosphate triphosphohydrolase family protein [Eubacterium aggregans]|uniref:deoxyguanosinetriphosphate triphosphohydrolase family protein n=1 Tax=Eubacterium aggregans TaxID=81409 RepID=UPI003F315ECD
MLKETNRKCFEGMDTTPQSEKWTQATMRGESLYSRKTDIRTPFGRDYTRILHSMAYRRLKYKTQVFFSPEHDHVSTRIDHVHYVVSISRIITEFLGLNEELAEAIAIGHDLGHTPFGHDGERTIAAIIKEEGIIPQGGEIPFWHGMNGLRCVDSLELLEGPDACFHNLDLTYAVRDGIIAHSGDIMGRALVPREDALDLSAFKVPGQYEPFTWEGCIIKLADNISYLGRDIDDAVILGRMDADAHAKLTDIVIRYAKACGEDAAGINNANIIHLLVMDLCSHSSPEVGIRFSDDGYAVMDAVFHLNRETIYYNHMLKSYSEYGDTVIRTVYRVLSGWCEDYDTNQARYSRQYPRLTEEFSGWLSKYWDGPRGERYQNKVVYALETDPLAYKRAIVDYIAGMTDRFLEGLYRSFITF